jgi:hypothetical protein
MLALRPNQDRRLARNSRKGNPNQTRNSLNLL